MITQEQRCKEKWRVYGQRMRAKKTSPKTNDGKTTGYFKGLLVKA